MVNGTMILSVCGDSYFSCDNRYPDTHFSEILSNRWGYKLINLARQGISNRSIRLQVDRAIGINPELIIFGSTTSDRLEWTLHSLWPHLSKKSYCADNGLDNIEYRYWPNPSRDHVDSTHACLWSDHISKYDTDDFDSSFTSFWKSYFADFYDENWQKQIDQWVIESSLATLENSNIDYLYMPNTQHVPSWVSHNKIFDIDLKFCATTNPSDASYHTTAGMQQKIADIIDEKFG